jgi:hypothetical protein
MPIERGFFQDGELVRRCVVVSLGKVVGEANRVETVESTSIPGTAVYSMRKCLFS